MSTRSSVIWHSSGEMKLFTRFFFSWWSMATSLVISRVFTIKVEMSSANLGKVLCSIMA